MNNNDLVRDDEELYRRIEGDVESEHYAYKGEKLTIRPKSFMDPCKKPSVDRAELRCHDPSLSRLDETQGVVSLIACDVRAIDEVITRIEDRKIVHDVDVDYDPEPGNSAHSKIIVIPELCGTRSKQERVFRSLRTALADIATENGWTLEPQE